MSKRTPESSAVDNARRIAADALESARRRNLFVADAVRSACAGRSDHAASLATELALGVVRHRLTLETVASRFLVGQWCRLHHDLRTAVLLGLYQVLFLDGIPDHAAVHESVALVERHGRKARGLVNAVLRETLRHCGRVEGDDSDRPRRFILTRPGRGVLFDVDLFPDPRQAPDEFLSLSTSHPATLVRRWTERFGPQRCERICRHGACTPIIALRPNSSRITPSRLIETLREEGVSAVADDPTGLCFLNSRVPLRSLRCFREGLFQPQDPTAHSVIAGLDLTPGQTVIDLCAAPGTKTTQAAERMRNRGLILATDASRERLARLGENTERLGITIVRVTPREELMRQAKSVGRIDWILLDVPCSNTGVLARRPDARYRFSPRVLHDLIQTQQRLLGEAADLATTGTRIVYSTCSLEPEENEDVIRAFLQSRSSWRLRRTSRTFPRHGDHPTDWRDGGGVAELHQQG